MTAGAAHASLPDWCVARYEALRAGALGEPVPAEARSGLTLFLRQGMWAWAQAAAVTPSLRHAGSEPTAFTGPEPRQGLGRLLTEMAWAQIRRHA